jgi:hypothetical protein
LTGDSQRQLLLEGKDALDPTWSSPCMADWSNTTYPCDGNVTKWDHVSGCSNGAVTGLALSGCGLDGTLPAAWSRLRSLQNLHLFGSFLKGPLPASWAELPGLVWLDLQSNWLSGTLPGSWAKIKSLRGLKAANTQLKGTLPESWKSLTGLSYLDLSVNLLTGPLPAAWGALAQLEHLQLTGNAGLSGTIPCFWSSIGRNSKGRVYGLGNRGRLYALHLGSTGLKGCYPSSNLKKAGDNADYSHSPTRRNQVSGVRGE